MARTATATEGGTTNTITDVAARAAVSKSTVSRAFSRPASVNPDTRERVLSVARELSYTPNRVARSLANGRTGNLGLFVPDISNPFFPPLMKAVQEEARRRDLALFMADSDEHSDDEFRLVRAMAEQVDGLVLASPRMSEEQVLEVCNLVPVVVINREIAGVPAVLVSSGEGAAQAVQHLAALGHRTVAYLAGPAGAYSDRTRREALLGAARRAKVRVRPLGPFEPRYSSGMRAADLLLATDATAAVVYNDLIAIGVMHRLRQRGAEVGVDLSVVGFDDTCLAPMTTPPLTTVRVPGAASGAAAVRRLVELISGGGSAAEQPLRLPTELIVRASTGPAPP